LSIIQSIILGIIQGVTEFFPISSSGHLVIIPYFFNWEYPPLYFTVTVHFATLAAVVTIFHREIFRIIRAVVLGIFIRKERATSSFKLGILLIVASIPAAIAGYFLNEYVESLFSSPLVVAAFLLVTALFLWLGERRGSRIEEQFAYSQDDHVRFNFFIAFMTGIGQAIAILPGISRSGSTISFARFFGVKRNEAVRFSFLLSVPVILGTFIFEIYHSSGVIFEGGLNIALNLLAGFFFAYLAGMLAIKLLVYIAKRKNLNIFAVYCVALAAATFIFYIIKRFI
jgi:undecaprenyl-diphosphatase